jgi:putative MATE family efflux protein
MPISLGTEDQAILRLALPALGALAAEPIYVLVDTGVVGHLGATSLAALALATSVVGVVISICAFLEYGVTPKVGRLFAAGDRDGAAHLGRQATIMATALGVLLALVAIVIAHPLLVLLGAHDRVLNRGVLYVRIAAVGMPFALVAVAVEGYLRGVARLKIPLVVLLGANALNVGLEFLLVYGVHWGLAGSAWGTVIAQAISAIVFVALLGLRPGNTALIDWRAIRELAAVGTQILLRTAGLYIAFILAGALLARIGTDSLAAHQIVFQLWNFLALALDALAIAAQVLVSHELGRGDIHRARAVANRINLWSIGVGIVFGLVMLALINVLPQAFTHNPRVLNRVHAVWWVFVAMQPFNGLVFSLDGILFGAGDNRFLALAMAPCALVGFVPLALVAYFLHWGIVGVWLALFAFILARLLACGWRFLGRGWTSAVETPTLHAVSQ